MHYSLQPIGGTVSYTLCADLKVEQQKEQQCNSWLFSGLCVCVFVCVSRLGVFSVAWLRKEKKKPKEIQCDQGILYLYPIAANYSLFRC